MKWKIVSDSSGDMFPDSYGTSEVGFGTVPLKIIVGETEYVDTRELDVNEMLEHIKTFKGRTSSACPSPDDWCRAFEDGDNIFAVTISSNLSGSYNSAMVARDIVLAEHPEKNIHVVDSHAVSGTMILIVERLLQYIEQGMDFETICTEIEAYEHSTELLFTLSSFENLIKNGRMSRVAGLVATSLGLRAFASRTPEGTIKVLGKVRGENAAFKHIVELMSSLKDLTDCHVIITHCNNLMGAENIRSMIEAAHKVAKITILPVRGLTAFYADQKGILVAF